jgi:hypothetical protein
MTDYAPLFYWVIRKERGGAFPWTDDPILQTYRFCNVRREDDRGTVWIRDNIRVPWARHPSLWLMLCIARQINWPETLAELILAPAAWPGSDDRWFAPHAMTAALNARKARGEKVYTGAYMISAPAQKGADKQAYIAETVIGALWERRDKFSNWFIRPSRTLQGTHEAITRSSGWGQFMAYQAVVDMRFTALLADAPDVATWAAAGPGTMRGLNRLHGRTLDATISQERALSEMRAIYKIVMDETGVAMDPARQDRRRQAALALCAGEGILMMTAALQSSRGGASGRTQIKSYAQVVALWSARYDTAEIAKLLDLPECIVARWVANFRDLLHPVA